MSKTKPQPQTHPDLPHGLVTVMTDAEQEHARRLGNAFRNARQGLPVMVEGPDGTRTLMRFGSPKRSQTSAGGQPATKEPDPMKETIRAVRLHPGINLAQKCYSYLATAQPDAWSHLGEMDRHFRAGELADKIRMAEAAEPSAEGTPNPNPKPKAGGAIANLVGLLNDNLKAAVTAAIAENETAALALLEALVTGGKPREAVDTTRATMPAHLAFVEGPNATEKARKYLAAKVAGFASKSLMAQNFEAGEYLRRGAPVL